MNKWLHEHRKTCNIFFSRATQHFFFLRNSGFRDSQTIASIRYQNDSARDRLYYCIERISSILPFNSILVVLYTHPSHGYIDTTPKMDNMLIIRMCMRKSFAPDDPQTTLLLSTQLHAHALCIEI